MMKGIAVVTGASSGIGEAFVKELVRDDYSEIWIVARREDRLNTLRSLLGDDRIVPVVMDLTGEGIAAAFEEKLSASSQKVSLLVNCAGMGVRGDVADNSIESVSSTIDLNCRSLSLLTGACLPHMEKGSRVINMASSAGFLPQPGFAVYAASKAYVIDYSRALDVELSSRGISVTCVCPGPVRTEFQSKATGGATGEFTGFRKLVAVTPGKLAAASLRAAAHGRHLYVYGFSQKLLHVASKLVPHYWIMKMERIGR